MADRRLTTLSSEAEEVASALLAFRDRLRSGTGITAIIGELFVISSKLGEIDAAQHHPRYAPSFYRVQDDIDLVLPTLQHTLNGVREMLARTLDRPEQMVWEDLCYRLEHEEGIGLLVRLQVSNVMHSGLL